MASKYHEEVYRVNRRLSNKDGTPLKVPKSVNRNDKCHCGSKKKYKHCCLQRDSATMEISKEEREKAIAKAKAEDKKYV